MESYNEAAFKLLVAMRGGTLPRKCDFCGQPYEGTRYPVPEEGRAWSCNECEAQNV